MTIAYKTTKFLAVVVLASVMFLTGAAFAILPANAVTCFFKYEQTSGMNKICYYDCLGSLAAITIDSFKLCPLTITQ